jgi:PLP dependent protein
MEFSPFLFKQKDSFISLYLDMNYEPLQNEISAAGATLIAVSKTHSVEKIMELYHQGHRDFGENKVQELTQKYEALPKDIRWHFIGHLQSNKIKSLLPMVYLIHGIDSEKRFVQVLDVASKLEIISKVLLQIHVAEEETKFGFTEEELIEFLEKWRLEKISPNIEIKGIMAMASNTENNSKIRAEFKKVFKMSSIMKEYFPEMKEPIISMGMSSDYKIALEEGSNMVRIGSILFGDRT